ncbi:hypothetical protein H9Q13_10660 [Pontibacter sp. JH31]|uniref:DUF349 domain-containing protein n=1 Tax=Pontibacter aquaedesilientis TaxID=2766980 RepID=A0ABR7XH94_9BACT|nr:hypothetical protein [Pontibacter aquaedesilientis]MBD1397629.1 hypothetical protein [Pontibacter aquaedesilientis]
MKQASLKLHVIVFFLSIVVISCTTTREQEVEGEVNEFRSWVNSQTSQLAERTEEDWKQTKKDFRKRTEELDRKQDKFSEKMKSDYQQVKEDFKAREREREMLAERKARTAEWERDLLGQYAERSAVNTGNIRQAYLTFMQNVRARHGTWGDQDWEMAKTVLEELNQRKEALQDLPDEDEVKIKALQMEFIALETGEDLGGD